MSPKQSEAKASNEGKSGHNKRRKNNRKRSPQQKAADQLEKSSELTFRPPPFASPPPVKTQLEPIPSLNIPHDPTNTRVSNTLNPPNNKNHSDAAVTPRQSLLNTRTAEPRELCEVSSRRPFVPRDYLTKNKKYNKKQDISDKNPVEEISEVLTHLGSIAPPQQTPNSHSKLISPRPGSPQVYSKYCHARRFGNAVPNPPYQNRKKSEDMAGAAKSRPKRIYAFPHQRNQLKPVVEETKSLPKVAQLPSHDESAIQAKNKRVINPPEQEAKPMDSSAATRANRNHSITTALKESTFSGDIHRESPQTVPTTPQKDGQITRKPSPDWNELRRQSQIHRPKNHDNSHIDSKQPRKSAWPTKQELDQWYLHGGEDIQSEKLYPEEEENRQAEEEHVLRSRDPDYDVRRLIDWEGKWMSAPVDWEERRCYKNGDLRSSLEVWMDNVETGDTMGTIDVVKEASFFSSGENSEVAPRCWIPVTIDGGDPLLWWESHMSSGWAAECCEPHSKPWWTLYQDGETNVLAPWPSPICLMNTADVDYIRFKKDLGSQGACEKRRLKRQKRRERQREIHELLTTTDERWPSKQEESPITQTINDQSTPEKKSIDPKLNVYLRLAFAGDCEQIAGLLNWHVAETVHIAELNPHTENSIRHKFNDITGNSLPMIVAVERSTVKAKGPQNTRARSQSQLNPQRQKDKIIGVVWVDDYHSRHDSAFGHTVDIELYVHHNNPKLGVGSCLLDKLMTCLDSCYQSRGGYQWVGEDYPSGAPERTFDKVLCHATYADDDKERLVFLEKWLGGYGFRKVGDLPRIGMKCRKWVNNAIFWFDTSNTFEPWGAKL